MLLSRAVRVTLVHSAPYPVLAYGGTERVVWWLSKALAARGVQVTLACLPGTKCDWAELTYPDFDRPIEPQLPDTDLLHFFNTPSEPPLRPHLVTIGGNGRDGEVFSRNTVFVSQNHARRHAGQCFVHNGLDPDDYIFSEKKDGSLLFLAKASWRVKNVAGAIRIAKKSRTPLHIVGGQRLLFKNWGGIHWEGMLGGREKAERIAASSALLFPVLWNEPFGIAVIEAMVSGLPVLASKLGSLPELVSDDVGILCTDERGFVEAVGEIGRFSPKTCREWVLSQFTHHHMADQYLRLYEKVLRGEFLNAGVPVTQEAVEALYSIPFRGAAGSSPNLLA